MIPQVDEEGVLRPDGLELVVELGGPEGEGYSFRSPSKQVPASRVHGEEELADALPSRRVKKVALRLQLVFSCVFVSEQVVYKDI